MGLGGATGMPLGQSPFQPGGMGGGTGFDPMLQLLQAMFQNQGAFRPDPQGKGNQGTGASRQIGEFGGVPVAQVDVRTPLMQALEMASAPTLFSILQNPFGFAEGAQQRAGGPPPGIAGGGSTDFLNMLFGGVPGGGSGGKNTKIEGKQTGGLLDPNAFTVVGEAGPELIPPGNQEVIPLTGAQQAPGQMMGVSAANQNQGVDLGGDAGIPGEQPMDPAAGLPGGFDNFDEILESVRQLTQGGVGGSTLADINSQILGDNQVNTTMGPQADIAKVLLGLTGQGGFGQDFITQMLTGANDGSVNAATALRGQLPPWLLQGAAGQLGVELAGNEFTPLGGGQTGGPAGGGTNRPGPEQGGTGFTQPGQGGFPGGQGGSQPPAAGAGGFTDLFRALQNNPEQQAFQQAMQFFQSQGGATGNSGQGVVDALRPIFKRNLETGLGSLRQQAPSVFNSAFFQQGADFTQDALNDFNLMAAQALQQGQGQQAQNLGLLGQLAGQAGQNPFQRLLGAGGLAQSQQQFESQFNLARQAQDFNQNVNPTLQLLLAALGQATPTAFQTFSPGVKK